MREILRICFICFLFFLAWQYYWGTMHCLEYDSMGMCRKRCARWDGWTCVKIRDTHRQNEGT